MQTIAVIGTRGFPGIQGGVEVHSENLYSRMKNVKLRVYRRNPYLTDSSYKKYNNIEYVDLPSTRIKGLEAILHTFISVLHILFHRVDIVHIHNIGPGLFTPLLKFFGLKVVLTYHSPNYEHKKWGWFARNLLRLGEYLSLNYADRIIFVNKSQMQKFSARRQAKSVHIVNGITPQERSSSHDYVDSLGLKKGEYLLSVGRLTPEKGFEYLVEAVNKVDEIKQVVIAGAGDHGDSYKRELQKIDVNKKVVFAGFVFGENLRQLYSNARMYVLSSVNEGFPLVLLEAMNYQLPIVASNIPATQIPQLTADDYFESENADSLSMKLKEKWEGAPAVRMYDLAEYDWERIADRTIEVYESLFERK